MAKNKVGLDMTEGPVFRTLISFGSPIIISFFIQQLYSMVDLMVIGKFVGSTGTVAVSTGSELIDFMTLMATAISGAAGTYIAQLAGAKNTDKTRVAVGTLFSVTIILIIIFTAGSIIFFNPLLKLINCPDEAFNEAAAYLIISAIGIPFVFGYNTIGGILRGIGESKRPLYFVTIAAIINVFLDLVLVAWFHLDAAGTAIATVAAQAGSFIAAFIFFCRNKMKFDFEFKRHNFRIDGHVLKVILKLGIPQLIRVIAVQGSMLWVKSNINACGLITSATYSIGNKIDKLLSGFTMGISGGCSAMVGQNLGAKQYKRVKQTIHATLFSCTGIAVAIAVLFLLIPKPLYSVFTNDQPVIEYGVVFLQIMAVGCVVTALSSTYKCIASGAGAAFLCFLIGVLDGVCRIAICLLFYNVFNLGDVSYFWGAALCQLVPGLICLVYFISGAWKRKKLLFEE